MERLVWRRPLCLHITSPSLACSLGWGLLLLQLISSMTSLAGVGWTVYTCLQVRCLPDNGPCNPFKNLAE